MRGNVCAQDSLAACYEGGLGVAKDQVEAVTWYRKAAEQGDADAEFNLGRCLHEGLGVKQDKAEAVKWTEKAAEQGIAEAQMMTGLNYWAGTDTAMDATNGVRWFEKAAEQDQVDAFYYLGGAYYFGRGVAQDYVQSYKWGLLYLGTDKSVITNDDVRIQILAELKETLADLDTKLTQAQIKEGKRLADETRARLAKKVKLEDKP